MMIWYLKHNFQTFYELKNLVMDYDYNSLMHLVENKFSKNGKPTMVVLKKGIRLGGANGWSSRDVEKLKELYC